MTEKKQVLNFAQALKQASDMDNQRRQEEYVKDAEQGKTTLEQILSRLDSIDARLEFIEGGLAKPKKLSKQKV